MIKLYDSAFSPFARKVRMVLEYKGLNYEAVDGLLKSNHAALKAVNGRIEVPALVDSDIVVVNSADIVAVRLATGRHRTLTEGSGFSSAKSSSTRSRRRTRCALLSSTITSQARGREL